MMKDKTYNVLQTYFGERKTKSAHIKDNDGNILIVEENQLLEKQNMQNSCMEIIILSY